MAVAEKESMPKDSRRRGALKAEADGTDAEGDDESAKVAPTTQTWKLGLHVTATCRAGQTWRVLRAEDRHTMARVTATAGATRFPLTLTNAALDEDSESPSRGCCMELPEAFTEAFARNARLFFQS